MKPRVLVFGIDGASHRVVQELLSKDRLPNLARLVAKGSQSVLQSTFPPHTAPGWASMFTGVEPGEHGIYQFWQTQSHDYQATVTTIHDFGWEPIWDTLERHGLTVGIVNVPMSHPPKKRKDNGYMITWPLAPTIHYSEPHNLISELAKHNLHYHSDLVTMYRGQRDYFDQAVEFTQGRTQSILYLMEHYPVDALFVVYTEVDRVSHYYWGDDIQQAEKIEQIYEETDRALGKLLDELPEETLVFVTSDHGFGHCSKNVNIHYFLEQNGFTNITFVPGEDEVELNSSDNFIGEEFSSWHTSSRRYYRSINWDKTQAYMPTPGCFGINLNLCGRERQGIVNPGEHASEITRQLQESFKQLVDDDNIPLFDLLPREEVYKGHRLEDAPDLILMPRKHWDIMPHTNLDQQLFSPPTQEAIHRMDGIMFAQGSGIPKSQLSGAKIEDITPTILSLLNLPVQEELTGRCLFDTPTPIKYEPARRLIKENNTSLSNSEQDLLKKRLKDLGYA